MSDTLRARLAVWGWGMVVAVTSAVANAGTLALSNPGFVLDHWREMLPMLAVAAGREVFLYLRRSPLPELPVERTYQDIEHKG